MESVTHGRNDSEQQWDELRTKVFARSKTACATKMENETVVLEVEQGQYFTLNYWASEIWNQFDGKIELEKVLEGITDRFDTDTETAREDLIDLIERLESRKLIERARE